jgi:hypothetical protein
MGTLWPIANIEIADISIFSYGLHQKGVGIYENSEPLASFSGLFRSKYK